MENRNLNADAKFAVGGVYSVWSNGPYAYYTEFQVVAIDPDRKGAWIVPTTTGFDHKGAFHYDIINDTRFGEKLRWRDNGWFYVVRADKQRGENKVDATGWYDKVAADKKARRHEGAARAAAKRKAKKLVEGYIARFTKPIHFARYLAFGYSKNDFLYSAPSVRLDVWKQMGYLSDDFTTRVRTSKQGKHEFLGVVSVVNNPGIFAKVRCTSSGELTIGLNREFPITADEMEAILAD